MTDGLVTRIGKWLDYKWAPKATWQDVERQESRCSERHIGALSLITELKITVTELNILTEAPSDIAKELADMKTRFEKLELYLGMSRKVDPTKPAVAKSAFSM